MIEQNQHQEDDSLQPFVEQSLDRIDQIEKDMSRLEKTEYPDPESVTRIYSIIVAIKESSNLYALENIAAIAGGIAAIMDKLFKKELDLNSQNIHVLVKAFDFLTEIVGNASHSSSFDISEMLNDLKTVESGKIPESELASDNEISGTPENSSAPKDIKIKTFNKSADASLFKKKYGISDEIDLYSNSNPIGVSKAVSLSMERMSNCCDILEENNSDLLKFGLAKRHEISEDKFVTASTLIEILDLLLRISVTPGRDHILSYSYGLPEYSSVAALCGVELLRLRRARNFVPPLDSIVNEANENTAAVIITNPDIPSGYGIAGEEIATMANILPKRTLLIIDERCVEFSWPEDDYTALHYLDKAPNLIVLRSFSWSFGLRGLKLGYGMMNSHLARKLEESRLPVPISPINVGAGLAALNHSEFYYSTIALIIKGREILQKGLEEAGCTVFPSQSNFVMFGVPIPVEKFYEEMLARGLRIRRLHEFGLQDLMTVSIGKNSRNRVFLAAVNDILA